MVAARPTFEFDKEIIGLICQKEHLQHDLQDPSLSPRRRATLQQQLAAVQAHLVALQAIVDGQWNATGLSVTCI